MPPQDRQQIHLSQVPFMQGRHALLFVGVARHHRQSGEPLRRRIALNCTKMVVTTPEGRKARNMKTIKSAVRAAVKGYLCQRRKINATFFFFSVAGAVGYVLGPQEVVHIVVALGVETAVQKFLIVLFVAE